MNRTKWGKEEQEWEGVRGEDKGLRTYTFGTLHAHTVDIHATF